MFPYIVGALVILIVAYLFYFKAEKYENGDKKALVKYIQEAETLDPARVRNLASKITDDDQIFYDLAQDQKRMALFVLIAKMK